MFNPLQSGPFLGGAVEVNKNIQALYDEVIRGANKFLSNCSRFSISTLQLEDPSYDVIATELEEIAFNINMLCGHSSEQGIRATEYCLYMRKLAQAIRVGDEGELATWLEALKRMTGT